MQSFLQYRKLRDAAKAQLERDRARAEGRFPQSFRSRHDSQDGSPASSSSNGSKVDLEKGSEALEKGSEAREHPPGVDPADAKLGCHPDESKEEDNMMRANQRPGDVRDFQEPVEEQRGDAEADDDDGDDFELGLNTRSTLSRTTTQQTQGTALGNVLTGIEVRRRTTREGGDGSVFVVGYEGEDDPNDPHNWSFATKLRCTITIASIGIVVGFASAIDSTAIPQAAKDFGVSEVTEAFAGTGIFLIGFGAGALFAGPFSETFGRNPIYIATLGLYMVFIMASGLAPNIGAQIVFRFLAGLFGSTPLTCAGGSLSDLWSPLERVYTFPVFANAAFMGPLLGPILGGFIAESSAVSWRWVEWTTLIFSGLILTLVVLTQPETFPPTLLKWKAEHLRELTGDQRYRGAIEVRQETLSHRLRRALYRPFLLTAREPIIILVALYLTVVYIILFGFLDGYTYIFTDMYGISQGITGLCFLGIIIGLFGASALVPLVYKWAKSDFQKIQEKGGDRLPPEFRCWFSMLGGAFAVPISCFWMGWTARPDISIWSPLAASVLFGYGILCIFITCYQYIIDSYETYAASGLASITLIRYIASGGMVVVSVPFYENMGVAYTLTILGCLSALLVPVPYVFFKYGPAIRARSKYAISPK